MADVPVAGIGRGGSTDEPDERLLSLVSSVSDYAIIVLDLDGNVASWNRGAERLKGYRADEIVGEHFSRFYSDEDVQDALPEKALVAALESGRYEAEGWRVRKDGSRFWANAIITPLRDSEGRLTGFGKVTRDLTERKQHEDALLRVLERERETARRLRELDDMKNELVAVIAHDLRTPIGLIDGFASLLESDWASMNEGERRDLVHRMHRRTRVLAELVDHIFDVARIETGQLVVERTPFDVRSIAERAIADTGAGDERIRMYADAPCPTALGDSNRTWQVITNLVSNALKFSPDDTVVEVSVRASGDRCVVSVYDKGCGIRVEDQPQVFERFTRLGGAGSAPGTGLGLYIARWLVEAQGGRIWLESEEGVGSTFTFTLPLASPPVG